MSDQKAPITMADILEQAVHTDNTDLRGVTLQEVYLLHSANIQRIQAIEQHLAANSADTREIVEWVRNGRLAGKVFHKSMQVIGRAMVWLAKIIGAAAVLWTMYTSLRSGRLPDVKLFP